MRLTSTTAPQNGLLARLRMICTPRILRKAWLAAGVVGILLVALNQGDVFMAGQVTGRVLAKSLVTPLIPFCVTLLGALLNSRPAVRAEALRPGRAAVRRSVGIAILVGSTIIAVNQGDVLLAGALTPGVLVKLLITPCVPFCVSLYGAYTAYWSALAAQHAATEEERHHASGSRDAPTG
jgi:hypothetical protein